MVYLIFRCLQCSRLELSAGSPPNFVANCINVYQTLKVYFIFAGNSASDYLLFCVIQTNSFVSLL